VTSFCTAIKLLLRRTLQLYIFIQQIVQSLQTPKPLIYFLFSVLTFGFSTTQTASAQLVYPNIYIQADSTWTYKNLQLIPIRFQDVHYFENDIPKKMLSFQKAMETGKMQVKEYFFNGDANVHLLSVKNKSKQPILIQSGDMISGGKQDRMVAETKIIPPNAEEEFIQVYCIERGRWDKKVKPFKYGGNADAWLQKIMDSTNQQQHIWKEIEHRLPINNNVVTTFPYLQSFNDSINASKDYIDFFTQKFKASDSSFAGFIAITDTGIINCQVFAHSSLTINAYSSLLQAWVHSVLIKGKQPNIPSKKLHHFTDELFTNEEKQKHFLLSHGKSYEYLKKVFHIIAYP